MGNTPKVTFDNYRTATINDFHDDFARIWERDATERSVFDLWFHVVDHASRIARAIRRQEPPAVIDDIADTVVWLMSFIAHCQRCNDTHESRFHFQETPAEIIWQKYPAVCPACLDSWVIGRLNIEPDDSPIRKFEAMRDSIYEQIHTRASSRPVALPCTCLTRVATHRQERDIVSSLRTELDAVRIAYADLLKSSGHMVQSVIDIEDMFQQIYANVHHVISLEFAVFHLLEEIGETTEALKDLYTYDNSREPYSIELHRYRKSRVLEEVADVISWMFAAAIKIRATYGRHAAEYQASIRPRKDSEGESGEIGMRFAEIIWSKYGTTKSGANWDRLKCAGCQAAPCECLRDFKFEWHPSSPAHPATDVARSENSMLDTERDLVFISYSHKDQEWLDRLQVMLKPLVRKKSLSVWDDKEIKPGQRWRSEIDSALRRANVAVLLVSPNFLASDFIAEKELPPLLDAARDAGTTIIWVPIAAALFEETDIVNYQAAHDPDEPLNSLSDADKDKVLKKICQAIKNASES